MGGQGLRGLWPVAGQLLRTPPSALWELGLVFLTPSLPCFVLRVTAVSGHPLQVIVFQRLEDCDPNPTSCPTDILFLFQSVEPQCVVLSFRDVPCIPHLPLNRHS